MKILRRALAVTIAASLVLGAPGSYAKKYGSSSKSKSWTRSAPVYKPRPPAPKLKAVKSAPSKSVPSKSALSNSVPSKSVPSKSAAVVNSSSSSMKSSSIAKKAIGVGATGAVVAGAATAASSSENKASSSGSASQSLSNSYKATPPPPPPPSKVLKVAPGIGMNEAEKKQARKTALNVKKEHEASISKIRSSEEFKSSTGGRTYSNQDIYSSRNNYYSSGKYSSPERVKVIEVYRGREYGGVDGSFLASALAANAITNSMFWYSMSNNRDVERFLNEERNRALRENDREMLERIERIEAENASLKASGVQPKAIHAVVQDAGVPAEVAYSRDVLTNNANDGFEFYTGSKGGMYDLLCSGDKKSFRGLKEIASEYGIVANCHNSGGGSDNLKKGMLGDANIFPVQADTLYFHKQKTGNEKGFGENEYVMYQEPFLMLASKDSNIDDMSDIDGEKTVYLYGSAKESWRYLTKFAQDDTFLGFGGNSEYAKAKVKEVKRLTRATELLKRDPNAVLFVVMSVDAEAIQSLDSKYGDELKLVPVDDDRFLAISDKGKRVYSECEIPEKALPKMQSGSFWSSGDTETLCTDALLIVDDQWLAGMNDSQRDLAGMAVTEMLEDLIFLNSSM